MGSVAQGRVQVLLSTEMAARGLDIPRLSHVLNFDPPSSLREYVHRAGRVGRISSLTPGKAGTVVTFVGSDEEAGGMVEMARELRVDLGEIELVGGEAIIKKGVGLSEGKGKLGASNPSVSPLQP